MGGVFGTALSWLASIVIPMALHLGVEAVLAKFPNLPPWLIAVLKNLEGAKQQALQLATEAEQRAAVTLARAEAAKQVHLACTGVACPPDLKNS
jgi:hypothetical protein